MEIYRGPSQIDGQLIVCITTESKNRKTGEMLQVWLLSTAMNPIKATYNNLDRSICGDCKHRNTSCYVALFQAPYQIYHNWKRGKYAISHDFSMFANRKVRFGAYGDPVAMPLEIIRGIAKVSSGWTGYTHQWKLAIAQEYKPFLMASVDTLAEYHEAKAMGWRTFRIKNAEESKLKQEIVCPASIEAGKKSNCAKCGLCSGLSSKSPRDIVINVHGLQHKQDKFKRMALEVV